MMNATDIGRQRGGNESFMLGLLDGLRSLPGGAGRDRFSLVACRDGMPALSARNWPPPFDLIDAGHWRRWPFYLWQQTLLLRRVRPDWYLSTFLLPLAIPCQAAVLVHDLSFRAHPEFYPPSIALYMRVLVGWAVRRAERVLTISEFTRGEIGRYYPGALSKTVVVHVGIGSQFTASGDAAQDDAALRAYGIEPPYLLAVGNIHPRKNLGRLLDAYLKLKQTRGELPAMAWVGVERWGSAHLQRRAREAGVQLTGRVAQNHLPALYRRAALVVYPSLYEGFGLPPLEAMACGTPAVAGNTSSLPEALGDDAILADPLDSAALAGAIERGLFDHALRAQLRERGLARARGYRWDKTAELVLSALRAK